jgi:hypothetical protein
MESSSLLHIDFLSSYRYSSYQGRYRRNLCSLNSRASLEVLDMWLDPLLFCIYQYQTSSLSIIFEHSKWFNIEVLTKTTYALLNRGRCSLLFREPVPAERPRSSFASNTSCKTKATGNNKVLQPNLFAIFTCRKRVEFGMMKASGRGQFV